MAPNPGKRLQKQRGTPKSAPLLSASDYGSEAVVDRQGHVRRVVAEFFRAATDVVGLLEEDRVHVSQIDGPVTGQAIFDARARAETKVRVGVRASRTRNLVTRNRDADVGVGQPRAHRVAETSGRRSLEARLRFEGHAGDR